MKNRMKMLIPIIIIFVSVIWLSIAYTDYCRVGINWDKPKFCILTDGADDGGSGKYIGLGYSFDIKGSFLEEDEYPKVERYTFKVLGITIREDESIHQVYDKSIN